MSEIKKYLTHFDSFKGNHVALRAAEIALAGSHDMCIIGPPSSGKSMLRAAMRELAYMADIGLIQQTHQVVEKLPCECGYAHDPERECTCSMQEIHLQYVYILRLKYDIHIRLTYPTWEELNDEHVLRRVEPHIIAARIKDAHKRIDESSLEFSGEAISVLKTACASLHLNPQQVQSCKDVAYTIAVLDHADDIGVVQMAEAISYALRR